MTDSNDDQFDEPDGQVSARILPNEHYFVADSPNDVVVVSVVDNDNRDSARRELISQLIRSVQPTVSVASTTRTRNAVNARLRQAFDGRDQNQFSIGGKSSFTDILTQNGERINEQSLSWESFMDGSSFTFELFPENGGGSPFAVWGIGDYHDLSGNGSEETLFWDGNMLSGQIGMDSRIDQNMVVGLNTSVFETETEFNSTATENIDFQGMYSIQTRGVHPYFGWISPEENAEVRTSVGYGSGKITVKQDGYESETADTSYGTVSIGGYRNIYWFENTPFAGNTELRLIGDAWSYRQQIL